MQQLDAVFGALADATRRELVSTLARGPCPAGELASAFPASRPGISRHLRVLREAGVVLVHKAGRRKVYRLAPLGLTAARLWLETAQAAPRPSAPVRPPPDDVPWLFPRVRMRLIDPPAA